jgi:hypothetical protein
MTIRIINTEIVYKGVHYRAGTSQSIIENYDDEDARRLIKLGHAEECDAPTKPPMSIFTESQEKIRNKIAEYEAKLAESEKELEALLDGGFQEDVAGITKKIAVLNNTVFSLKALIQRLQVKLEQAEKTEQLEAEKAVVKQLTKTVEQQRKEAEKILSGISGAVASLKQNLNDLFELRDKARQSFGEAGGGIERCPLNSALAIPCEVKDIEHMEKVIKNNLDALGSAAARTPETLANKLN